ncbi:hypothetical protein C8R44DRAFT_979910 [Mycena epipterygia]|nr:hypothetical protein C8R44DRAFT_979910 [Mycena epipterygia]
MSRPVLPPVCYCDVTLQLRLCPTRHLHARVPTRYSRCLFPDPDLRIWEASPAFASKRPAAGVPYAPPLFSTACLVSRRERGRISDPPASVAVLQMSVHSLHTRGQFSATYGGTCSVSCGGKPGFDSQRPNTDFLSKFLFLSLRLLSDSLLFYRRDVVGPRDSDSLNVRFRDLPHGIPGISSFTSRTPAYRCPVLLDS